MEKVVVVGCALEAPLSEVKAAMHLPGLVSVEQQPQRDDMGVWLATFSTEQFAVSATKALDGSLTKGGFILEARRLSAEEEEEAEESDSGGSGSDEDMWNIGQSTEKNAGTSAEITASWKSFFKEEDRGGDLESEFKTVTSTPSPPPLPMKRPLSPSPPPLPTPSGVPAHLLHVPPPPVRIYSPADYLPAVPTLELLRRSVVEGYRYRKRGMNGEWGPEESTEQPTATGPTPPSAHVLHVQWQFIKPDIAALKRAVLRKADMTKLVVDTESKSLCMEFSKAAHVRKANKALQGVLPEGASVVLGNEPPPTFY